MNFSAVFVVVYLLQLKASSTGEMSLEGKKEKLNFEASTSEIFLEGKKKKLNFEASTGEISLEGKQEKLNFEVASVEMDEIVLQSSKNKSTPVWQFCEKHLFNGTNLQGILRCIENGRLAVLDCNCVTNFPGQERILEAGKCTFNCGHFNKEDRFDMLYNPLPSNLKQLNKHMCGQSFNRNGTLCGKCKNGFHPLAYSYDMACVKCPNGTSNWWKYLMAAFLPLTVFYFIILLFRINITTSHFFAFVHFSQTITMPAIARATVNSTRFRPYLQATVKVMGNIYGIWNMDFFRFINYNICLGTDTLQTLALDTVVGVYPLLLILLSYALVTMYDQNYRLLIYIWRPFKIVFSRFHKKWDIKTSLIDAFAALFFLSNVKLVSLSADLLTPVMVYQIDSTGNVTYSWRLFYDATLPYFGERHYKYGILAITVLVIDVLLPLLLLNLYPFHCFQKLLNLFPFRWYILHTFMDSFQGCYKDGTGQKSSDCRWFSSLFLVIHVSFFVAGGATQGSMFFAFAAIIEITAATLLIIVAPFKHNLKYHGKIHVLFHLLVATMSVSFLGALEAELSRNERLSAVLYTAMAATVGVLPMLYVCFFIIKRVCNPAKFRLKLVAKFVAWRHGYDVIE